MAKLKVTTVTLCILVSILVAGSLNAATFHVNTAEALKIALSVASGNFEDDVIYLDSGTYSGGFEYYAGKNENSALTLRAKDGLSPSQVVLDGGTTNRVFLFTDVYDDGDCGIHGITVQNGTGWFSGGLEISTGGIVTVSNCVIRNNSSSRGGGIFASGSKITIENNTITDNSASNGGAIYPLGGEVLVQGNTLSNNTVSGDGGGIRIAGTPLTINNNIITDNTATRGGAVHAFQAGDGIITLTNNTIMRNSASNGGGLSLGVTTSVLVNNVIALNNALFDGGGVDAGTNSGAVTLTNNTITANYAGDDGGGLYINVVTEAASLFVYNNIMWANNAVGSGADVLLDGQGIKYGFNNDYTVLSGAWSNSGNNIDADPAFVDASGNDYHLTAGSPCIDAGDNGAPSLPFTDKDGNIRVSDGNGNGDAVVDMGAYEYVSYSPVRGEVIPDIEANGSDGPITIAQGEDLSVVVSLDAGTLAGQQADRWINAWTPFGWISFRYLDSSWYWVLGLSKTWEGTLNSVDPVEIFNLNTLPRGDYFFFYGIDVGPDGSMDYFDTVTVVVGDLAGVSQNASIPQSVFRTFMLRK